MSVDLSAIVESVARASYESRVLEGDLAWDDVNGFTRYSVREQVLPIVTATLRALTPLVESWERLAEQDRLLALRRIERAEGASDTSETHKQAEHAHHAEGAYKANAARAAELRGVIGA